MFAVHFREKLKKNCREEAMASVQFVSGVDYSVCLHKRYWEIILNVSLCVENRPGKSRRTPQ